MRKATRGEGLWEAVGVRVKDGDPFFAPEMALEMSREFRIQLEQKQVRVGIHPAQQFAGMATLARAEFRDDPGRAKSIFDATFRTSARELGMMDATCRGRLRKRFRKRTLIREFGSSAEQKGATLRCKWVMSSPLARKTVLPDASLVFIEISHSYGKPMSNLNLITVKETAEYLRIPLPTVYYLVQRGQIPAVQIGGRWRVKKDLLDRDVLRKEEDSGQPTVLVVDDDEGLQEMFKLFLKRAGLSRLVVGTGKDALAAIDKQKLTSAFSISSSRISLATRFMPTQAEVS
jgi:excisionase family DNA binding protein